MIRETAQGTIIDIEVQPNSKRFEIGNYDPWTKRLKIKLTKNPINGKANKELISTLSKILGSNVTLVKGEKSTKKTVLTTQTKKEVKKRLEL